MNEERSRLLARDLQAVEDGLYALHVKDDLMVDAVIAATAASCRRVPG